jgi:hypothetical protein
LPVFSVELVCFEHGFSALCDSHLSVFSVELQSYRELGQGFSPVFSVALVRLCHGFRDPVMCELMMDFAQRDEAVVVFGLGESDLVVKNLCRLVAIFAGTFSVGCGKG